MAFTSADETDLLLPLFQGAQENPPFLTFLTRILRRTTAEYFSLVIRRRDGQIEQRRAFSVGIDLDERAQGADFTEGGTLEQMEGERLHIGRIYSPSEFTDHDPAYLARRARTIERLGILDERVIRFFGENGVSAWLVLARQRQCSAADSALLSNLAPYVAAAIRSLVLIERESIKAATGVAGLERVGAGCLVLDQDARLILADPATTLRLRNITGILAREGEALHGMPAGAGQELAHAAAAFSAARHSPTRAIVLSESPRVDALLVPAETSPLAALRQPAMLVLCRFPTQMDPARAALLARVFNLPRREAELALALSDGLSIADAAKDMGLTLETARNYSKRIYSRLGVSGQAQLVRLILQSSAALDTHHSGLSITASEHGAGGPAQLRSIERMVAPQ